MIMDITCISDLHGYQPELPGGDLLILAGDYTATNHLPEWSQFFQWLKQQNYNNKIIVAGNHDGYLSVGFPKNQSEADEVKEVQKFLQEIGESVKPDFEYLCDSGTEVNGLKIWGSPWTPWFSGVNPKCKYFMKSEGFLDKRFALIPNDIDILITHCPPYGILDKVEREFCASCGNIALLEALDRTEPRFHIFGHIHEHGSKQLKYKKTLCINCSYVDENYHPSNSYVRIEI